MVWAPTDPQHVPAPDVILARLHPQPGDVSQTEGFIGPDDLAFAWQAILSSIVHLGTSNGDLHGNLSAALLRTGELEARWDDLLGDTPSTYEATGAYSVGNVARFGGKVWMALADVTGVDPGTDPAKWEDISYPAMVHEFGMLATEIGDIHGITAGSLVTHIAGIEARLAKLEATGAAPPVAPTADFVIDCDPAYSGNFVTISLGAAQVANVTDDAYDGQPHIWEIRDWAAGKSETDLTVTDDTWVWVTGSKPGDTPNNDLKHIATAVREISVGVLKSWVADAGSTFLTVERKGDAWLITNIAHGVAP